MQKRDQRNHSSLPAKTGPQFDNESLVPGSPTIYVVGYRAIQNPRLIQIPFLPGRHVTGSCSTCTHQSELLQAGQFKPAGGASVGEHFVESARLSQERTVIPKDWRLEFSEIFRDRIGLVQSMRFSDCQRLGSSKNGSSGPTPRVCQPSSRSETAMKKPIAGCSAGLQPLSIAAGSISSRL